MIKWSSKQHCLQIGHLRAMKYKFARINLNIKIFVLCVIRELIMKIS